MTLSLKFNAAKSNTTRAVVQPFRYARICVASGRHLKCVSGCSLLRLPTHSDDEESGNGRRREVLMLGLATSVSCSAMLNWRRAGGGDGR